MKSDTSAKDESEFKFSDLFCSIEVLSTAIQELCHYHPMGVYYYVWLLVLYHRSYRYPSELRKTSDSMSEMRSILTISLSHR